MVGEPMDEALSTEINRLAELAWRVRDQSEFALQEAEDLLREYLSVAPDSVLALTLLGAVLSNAGCHEAAVVELRRAAALGSTDANTYYNLAVALMNTGMLGRGIAEPYFQRAATLSAHPQTFQAFFDPHGH